MTDALFDMQYAIPFLLTVAAMLVVAAILGTIRWTRERIFSFVGRLLGRSWSELKRLFSWGTAEVQEWRRLFSFRRRALTWDDLSQNSKDNVRFHDFSESARQKIRLSDLPRNEKHDILSKIFLPKIYDTQYDARLALLDNRNSPIYERDVKSVVKKVDDFQTEIWQDGMELHLTIEFQSCDFEIPFDKDRIIHFDAEKSGNRWFMLCKPKYSRKELSGSHKVAVWIYHLRFNGLVFYQSAVE